MKSTKKQRQVPRRLNRKATIEARDRKFRELEREHSLLWKARSSAPIVKLDKPYQKGFKKFFVVRDDITRRHDGNIIAEILKLINSTVYMQDEEFVRKHKKRGKVVKQEIVEPQLHCISPHLWDKLGPSVTNRYKKYCSGLTVKHIPTPYGGYSYTRGYFFLYPWMFVTKVEPHFITHVREVLPAVESRLGEIDNYFDTRRVWRRLGKLQGWRYSYDECEAPTDHIGSIAEREQLKEIEKNVEDD